MSWYRERGNTLTINKSNCKILIEKLKSWKSWSQNLKKKDFENFSDLMSKTKGKCRIPPQGEYYKSVPYNRLKMYPNW